MKIGAPKELFEGEARVALTPQSAEQLQKLGYTCVIESGAGEKARFTDKAYRDAGVEVVEGAEALYAAADIVLKVRAPEESELGHLRKDQIYIHTAHINRTPLCLYSYADSGHSHTLLL